MWVEDSGMWAPAFLFLLPLRFSLDAITQTPPAPRPIPLCPDDMKPAPSPTLWPRAPPSPLYPELTPMHRPVIRRALTTGAPRDLAAKLRPLSPPELHPDLARGASSIVPSQLRPGAPAHMLEENEVGLIGFSVLEESDEPAY